jgi:hypothetical protein
MIDHAVNYLVAQGLISLEVDPDGVHCRTTAKEVGA